MRHETTRLIARAVAHDLANYSLVVRGHAELLREGGELDIRAGADAILRASTKITTLSARLRSLAAGDCAPTVVDAQEVVDDVVALIGRDEPVTSGALPVAVAASPDDVDRRILVDPHRLATQLIDRFFDAADVGADVVRFRTRVEDDPSAGRLVVIEVDDDAPPGSRDGPTDVALRFPEAQLGTASR